MLRNTTTTRTVLSFLAEHELYTNYGLNIMEETGLVPGTVYPILQRLIREELAVSQWEDIDPSEEGRPARRLYNLTREGREVNAEFRKAFARRLGRSSERSREKIALLPNSPPQEA